MKGLQEGLARRRGGNAIPWKLYQRRKTGCRTQHFAARRDSMPKMGK